MKVTKLEQKEQELREIKSKLDELSTWKQSVTDNIKSYFQRTTGKHYEVDDFEKLEKEQVEWIKKENEKRKRLGLNLIEENAFKHETIKLV